MDFSNLIVIENEERRKKKKRPYNKEYYEKNKALCIARNIEYTKNKTSDERREYFKDYYNRTIDTRREYSRNYYHQCKQEQNI